MNNNKLSQFNEYLKKETNYFVQFLSNFEIIGLTIASIIGLSITSLTKTFTDEIIMQILEPLLSVKNWKNFRIVYGKFNLGIGLFIADMINLLFIAFTMFLLYSFFKYYLSDVMDHKVSWKTELVNVQNNNNKLLKCMVEELKLLNKKKQSNQV